MEIKKQYLQKYLHDIAVDQIAEEYQQKGYSITKEEQVGKKYRADLIARKNDETIVIEIKSGKMTPYQKQKITELANYVRRDGNNKFLVVIATPPKEKKLEIADIEELLTQYISENLPDDLDQLSTHTRLEELTDVEIDDISIKGNSIFVSGSGVVNIEIQFGSDGDQERDDGYVNQDNFPFEFEITLEYDANHKLKITNVAKLEIDTSSYYDD